MIIICFSILTGSGFLQIQQMRSKSPVFSYKMMPKPCILFCLLCWDSSRVPRYDHSFCDLYWFVVCKYKGSSYFLPHCECSNLSKVVASLWIVMQFIAIQVPLCVLLLICQLTSITWRNRFFRNSFILQIPSNFS